jgi:photoactive yellow protein
MPLDTTTRMLAPFLDRLTVEELDALPYGVVQLDVDGYVLSYNRAEAENAGVEKALGRHYFAEVAPCANTPEFHGLFLTGVASRRLDETFVYTFMCGLLPRRVQLRMYYSVRTGSVWLFLAQPDGSPFERDYVVPASDIRPVPDHGFDLRAPRVA